MSKVLVTGAAGFIGSFLTQRLLNEGFEVIGIDNLFRGKEANLASSITHKKFYFYKLDITQQLPNEIFQNVEAVFHYAAINGTAYFYEIPEKVLGTNVEGTINILRQAVKHGVQKFVFASSSEVYGEPLYFPTDENQPIILSSVENPRFSYAASKVIGEYYVNWIGQKAGLSCLILRIFNTYGPRMDTSSYGQVIPEFIRKIMNDKEFTLFSPGTQTRSFCYIGDNIEFAMRAYNKLQKGITTILNVGNDEEVTILELAKLMHKIAGRHFEYKLLPCLEGDPPRRVPDITRITELTGYRPNMTLEEGIKKIMQYREEIP